MEKIKNWLQSPEFDSGVDLLEEHSTLRNMVRIMRRSGESAEHMETLQYELGKLVPAEEVVTEPDGDEESECKMFCGSNYCDENGCNNRKINLVDPIAPVEETEEGKKQATARVNIVLSQAKLLCKTLFLPKTNK